MGFNSGFKGLKRNVYKCTKPLLAAKTSLGLP